MPESDRRLNYYFSTEAACGLDCRNFCK
jgi:hypothetical protein